MKSLLIVGSQGALGKDVLKTFIKDDGFNVFHIGRKKLINFKNNQYYSGDLQDLSFCNRIKKLNKMDCIIYLLGDWKRKTLKIQNYDSNYQPFKNFLKTFASITNHIIFFSSSAVYKDSDYTEKSIDIMPETPYGFAKAYSELQLIKYCNKYNKNYTILRPFHIVSKHEKYDVEKSHVITDIIYKTIELKQNIKFYEDNDIYIPFTWAEDISKLLKKMTLNNNCLNNIYNIGNNKEYFLNDVIRAINNKSFMNYEYNYRINNTFNKCIEHYGNYNETSLNEMIKIKFELN